MENTTDWQPADSSWSFEEWMGETRTLRDALSTLGASVPHCLPGEPDDCGSSVWAHYATYSGMIRAAGQLRAECNLGPGPGAELAENVYAEQLAAHRHGAGHS